ncbi:MAG: EpsD family peptidyl-prolyl cis-trans isomerase [Burkholderiaceae bacterium]|nr:EpsD family peptidyl-prolyl cis-trans isomerase [Burkholderiaceae bacterium]
MMSRLGLLNAGVAGRCPGPTVLIALLVSIAALVGCSDKQLDTTATQAAAKVNREEITVQQINFVLQQQRGLKLEQAEAASKQILERLIDQELALQKAQELRLDREPRVIQLIEAARREIVARAYAEKSAEAAAKPSADEIKKYYDAHPALFSARRIYTLQEVVIEAKAEQVSALREQLGASKNINEFVEYLKSNNYRFAGNQAVRTAEQVPLNMLDAISRLSDGQAMLVPTGVGAQVIVLAGSRSDPVDEARATPMIEQFLLNDAKRKLVESDMKALRVAAKIEYVGTFAKAAASSPAVSLPDLAASASTAQDGTSLPLDSESVGKGMGLK